jgi:hypothetical protein
VCVVFMFWGGSNLCVLSLGFGEVITWVYGALRLWGGYNLDVCCYKVMERL